MTFIRRSMLTDAPAAAILIRLVVGFVFFSEGVQKFLYPNERDRQIRKDRDPVSGIFCSVRRRGRGTCGALLIVGLLTRLASIPLIINMLVAIVSTKIPILLGQEFWGFSLRSLPYYGFWGMIHESRTDLAMLFGSIFLLIVGAGRLSVDAMLTKNSPDAASG